MMPDEVRTMNVERVLVIQGGRHPFKLGRLNYLKDPETAGRYEANPMHEACCSLAGMRIHVRVRVKPPTHYSERRTANPLKNNRSRLVCSLQSRSA